MSYIFLTPEQYNKIYSESSKILINANINERINSLQAENKKLVEALKLYINSVSDGMDGSFGRQVLEEIDEEI
jgi:hypothetical protein